MAMTARLIFLLSGFFVQSVLTQDPAVTAADNSAVKAGATDVTLTCTFANDAPGKRKWYKTDIQADNQFPDGSNVAAIKDSVTFDPDPASGTSSELKISEATAAHADTYICYTASADDAKTDSKSAYLEVLTPNCRITSDGADPENVEFSCGATYSGNWEPELAFGETADGPNTAVDGKTVTLTGKKAATVATVGSTWNCKATMKTDNFKNSVSVDSSKTDVEVADICSWPLAAPAVEPTVSAFSSTPTEGDEITCGGSDGVPPPTFSWTQGGTAITSDNGKLTLTRDHSGEKLTCAARNPYGQRTKEVDVPTLVTTTTVAITEAPVTAGSSRAACLLTLAFPYTILTRLV